MPEYSELEVGLRRRDTTTYDVLVRFNRPGDLERTPVFGSAQFNLDRLRALAADPVEYGRELTAMLFADANVLGEFQTASAVTDSVTAKLRLRLFIDRTAAELHDVRWEALRDPRDPARWIVTNPRVVFSRFLGSDWRPVRLRGRDKLRALVVVANPRDLNQWKPGDRTLAPVPVAAELARAKDGLGDLFADALVSDPAAAGRVTLRALEEKLRSAGGFDVLYLVCHGALMVGGSGGRQEPYLWLEKDDGASDVVAGINLVDRMYDLPHPPRVVVLASCESGGKGRTDDGGALAALGPRLAESGVPAVLAMQGNVGMDTVADFMPAFFAVLRETGQVDEAVTAGRAAVRDRDDATAPALYLRLRTGCVWNRPGANAGAGRVEFKGWDALVTRIQMGKCTPILGPGLLEFLVDPSRDLALAWADTHGFPMAPSRRDDLPQVVQFLRTGDDPAYPDELLVRTLYAQIAKRYEGACRELSVAAVPQAPQLDAVMRAAARHVWETMNPAEPHAFLARLPLPIYLTTNPDRTLEEALARAGRAARAEVCPWKPELARKLADAPPADPPPPTPQAPLVYHLFGRFDDAESMVLSEDDYLDYLIGTAENRAPILKVIGEALASNVLLFLGFRLDDWNFRVLFRSVLRLVAGRRVSKYAHVAVQVDPEEGRFLDPDRARQYLEKYFAEYIGTASPGSKLSIFWGSERDFLDQLREEWNKRVPPADRIDDRPGPAPDGGAR